MPADGTAGQGEVANHISTAAQPDDGIVAQGLEAQAQRLQSDIVTGQAAADRASANAAAAAAAVKQLEADIEADIRMKASILAGRIETLHLLQRENSRHTAWSFAPSALPIRCLHDQLHRRLYDKPGRGVGLGMRRGGSMLCTS